MPQPPPQPTPDSHADPAQVRLLALDVDGVLSDGTITYGDRGTELKGFNAKDGFGITLWRQAGGEVAIVTGRGGEAVQRRAADLGIELIVERTKDKAEAIANLARRTRVGASQMAFVGDDWPDLPAMRAVGYPIAPADAEPEVLAAAAFVTARAGGRGAVRDAVMHLLWSRDDGETVRRLLARYDPA
ncbi:MAG: 3-deoxy-D-manno-octulosonate 8-phosphate phosphatase (KDO 8-P phosphatase) [Phycisphaerales bacterium]|jgi:3-deoxy-D-manno-octulosonate 8-phosphate phosphatase (KDO 8-P phosphatase)